MAASPGTIVWVGWGLFTETPGNVKDPYGLAVAIRHDFGYNDQKLYTVYAHMSKTLATIGQHVETGDLIGLVGATGATTGPHMHFEVRLSENSFHHTLNPELWLAPPQGWGVLVGRVMDTKGNVISRTQVRVTSEETNKTFLVKTYGSGGAINPDPYYNENVVIGDLHQVVPAITGLIDRLEKQHLVQRKRWRELGERCLDLGEHRRRRIRAVLRAEEQQPSPIVPDVDDVRRRMPDRGVLGKGQDVLGWRHRSGESGTHPASELREF
jgi:hypothetical protein